MMTTSTDLVAVPHDLDVTSQHGDGVDGRERAGHEVEQRRLRTLHHRQRDVGRQHAHAVRCKHARANMHEHVTEQCVRAFMVFSYAIMYEHVLIPILMRHP